MTRLQRFQGTPSLPGVGSPGIVADRAVGDATVQLGRQIGQSATAIGNLAERARKREENLKTFSAAIEEERRLSEVKAKRAEERKNNPSEPVAFTRETLDFIKTTGSGFQKDYPDNPQQGNQNNAFYSKEELLHDFAVDAVADSEAYQLREIEKSREFAVSEIREKPERFDKSLARLVALIDIAPLPMAKKKSTFLQVRESLAEAWLTTLPIKDQVAGLQLLKSKRDAASDAGVAARDESSGQSVSHGRRAEDEAEHHTSFEMLAQYLPSHKQDKLLANAIKEKAINETREEVRIAALIADDPFSVAPQEIHDSESLEHNQRMRLLSGLQDRIAQRENELEAIDWFVHPESHEPDLRQYEDFAERTYKSIDADPLNKEAFLGSFLRNRSPLPTSILSEISKGIRSRDASEISAAFTKLEAIEALPANLIFNGGANLATQRAFAIWKGLTELKGISQKSATDIVSKNKIN